MLRIGEGWMTYINGVLPADAPQVQIDECRLAFFAGAAHVYGMLISIEEHGSEADGIAQLQQLGQDLKAFGISVHPGDPQ